MKKITCLTILCVISLLGYSQTKDSVTYTMLVADFDYTCHTLNPQGEDVNVEYGLTLQIAQNMACTMGQKRHRGENDKSEQLLYVPTTWQNYPQGKITSVETIPPYQYLTSQKMPETKWSLQAERDTICGRVCQKATGTYGGRAWTVWFAESLPTRFGPWMLNGLPGLIMRAVSDDETHRFECSNVEAVKEAITYSVPEDAVKCTRGKFVKLRNQIFCNPNYVSNPTYYIKAAELENVIVMGNTVVLGRVPIDMKPVKFQPLDY